MAGNKQRTKLIKISNDCLGNLGKQRAWTDIHALAPNFASKDISKLRLDYYSVDVKKPDFCDAVSPPPPQTLSSKTAVATKPVAR